VSPVMNGRGRVENVRRHSIEAVQRPVGSRVSHHVSVLCLLEPIAAGAAIVHPQKRGRDGVMKSLGLGRQAFCSNRQRVVGPGWRRAAALGAPKRGDAY